MIYNPEKSNYMTLQRYIHISVLDIRINILSYIMYISYDTKVHTLHSSQNYRF